MQIPKQELLKLLKDLESDRVERRSSLSRKAICAFANDLPDHRLPGVLFVGVDDRGGCANLPITDELLRELAHMRSDGNITPFPTMTVSKMVLEGCELAVVIVQPADAPPVRYKGRVWVRVGPQRALATAEEERRLSEKRRARDLPFDLWPVHSAELSDLDLSAFREIYLPSAVALKPWSRISGASMSSLPPSASARLRTTPDQPSWACSSPERIPASIFRAPTSSSSDSTAPN